MVKWNFRNAVFLAAAVDLAVMALPISLVASVWQPESRSSAAPFEQGSENINHREARKAMRRGDYDTAAKIYSRLLVLNPDDFKARIGVSLAFLKMSDYARCFDAASEALNAQRTSARAHSLAGIALLRSGYVRLASEELQIAVNLDPNDALAYGGAAEVDYYEGRIAESRRKSIQAHKLDPDEPDYLITYARASSRAEDFKEAADAYQLFLQVAPKTDVERRSRILGLIRFCRRLSGIRVHQLSGAESADLPFYLGSDRRPYLHVKVNGRDALFVVDTGSGFTVISSEAAKHLGVSEIARGGKTQGVGGSGKFEIVYGLIRSMDIGATTLRMVPCFIRRFHGDVERAVDERANGFIGLSILAHFIAELDYKDHRLRLDRRQGSSLPAAGVGITVLPFRTTQNGLISVEAELDDKKTINAILDSGASTMVISAKAVERLKLDDQIIKGQKRSVIGAAGITPNVEMLLIRNCRVADLQQSNLSALIMDLSAINETSGFEQGGILGGDFLQDFRLTIDFNRAKLTLQRHTPVPTNQ